MDDEILPLSLSEYVWLDSSYLFKYSMIHTPVETFNVVYV
jgi:hypothetical protein